MLVQRDEVADDSVVELERALVLGKGGGLGRKLGDDVIAILPGTDGVGELAPSLMRNLGLLFGAEHSVEARDLVVDGGVFES